MANKIIIDVVANTDYSAIDKAEKKIDQLGQSAEKAKEGFEKGSSSAKKLGESLKSVGGALGLVGGLGLLVKVLSESQPIMDAVNVVLGTMTALFNQVTGAIGDAFESTSKLTGGFKEVGAVVKGVVGTALNILKLEFFSLKLILEELQLAWVKSPLGSGDTKRIKELQTEIETTKTKIAESGNAIKENATQVVEHIGGAITEIGKLGETVYNNLEKVNVKAAANAASRAQRLKKNAEIIEATEANNLSKLEASEEKKKQIRDSDLNSIGDRINANEELKGIIDEEEISMKNAANAALASAEANFKQNNTQANKVALIQAQGKVDAANAAIEAKRSEYQQNKNNLDKESIALTNSKIVNETDLNTKQAQFEASLIKDEEERIGQEIINLNIQREEELNNIQIKINSYKEGTQARVDAEKEYADKKQEINNNITQKENDLREKRIQKNREQNSKMLSDNAEIASMELARSLKYDLFSFKKKRDLIKADIQAKKELMQEEYLKEIQAAKGNKDALDAIEEKYRQKAIDLEKAKNEAINAERTKQLQIGLDFAQKAITAIGDVSAVFDKANENKIKSIDQQVEARQKQTSSELDALDRETAAKQAAIDAENISDEEKKKKKAALDKDTIKRKNEINRALFKYELEQFKAQEKLRKESFERNKKIQLGAAIIGTAAAVVGALGAQPWTPANIAAAVGVGVAGAAQIATILQTTYEGGKAPEFNELYPAATAAGGGSTPDVGNVGGVGNAPLRLPEKELSYTKVFVSESDIRDVSSRVQVIENRSIIR